MRWPLIPAVDDGSQKRTTRAWKALQGVADARPYDGLRAELWAVPTGAGIGAVVLDFDGATGDAVRVGWGLGSPHVRTGSGGSHVYVKHPGWPVRTCAGVVEGVDVRGDGGVAHVAGRSRKGPYIVLRRLDDMIPYRELCAEARACLKRRRVPAADTRAAGWIPGPGYRAVLIDWRVGDVRAAESGGRNQALNRAAWSLGQARVPLDEVLVALMAAAEDIGLGEREAEATIRSGWG